MHSSTKLILEGTTSAISPILCLVSNFLSINAKANPHIELIIIDVVSPNLNSLDII